MKWYYISRNSPKTPILMSNIQEIGDPKEEFVSCKLRKKGWGLVYITAQGEINWQIAPIYEDANSFSEGFWPYALEGKWGFLDKLGQSILSPQWDYVFPFSQGFAVAYKDGKRGMIDTQGQWAIAPRADDLRSYNEDISVGRLGQTWFFINLQGQTVGTSKATFVQSLHERLAAFNVGGNLIRGQVVMNGKWGFMNKKGEILISPQFSWVGNFSHQYAPYYDEDRDEWGVVSNTGGRTPISGVSGIRLHQNGEMVVEIEGSWGVMARDKSMVIAPEYDDIKAFGSHGYFAGKEE